MSHGTSSRLLAAIVALSALLLPAVAQASPAPPANPATGAPGAVTMHGDSLSSDTTPYAGPGSGSLQTTTVPVGAACPAALIGGDGMPVVLCTTILQRAPQVELLDPATGAVLTSLDLPKGGLFSGVYTYLDEQDRMVLISGEGDLIRIAHRNVNGTWQLYMDEKVSVAEGVSGHCGSPQCDAVVGITPDWRGRVWYATALGVVGLYDPRNDILKTRQLGEGEHVGNSISSAPGVTAIATDHALYELTARQGGRPRILWRRAYDRGPARKPGQLSYGTGATPTYFGPQHGAEYLTITDNASPSENLVVYRSAGRPAGRAPAKHPKPRLICKTSVLEGYGSGTENSPIGYDRSVIVASTYGYPYPAYPDDAGESDPATAPFGGGMTRIDLNPGGEGCSTRWTAPIRSAAVPKLSTADNLIYTTMRTSASADGTTSPLDLFSEVTIDPDTGKQLSSVPLGATTAYETLQLAGNIAPDGTLYQGTLTGILRIAAAG